MVSEARASNNIGQLPDHSGGGEVILSFTSLALQKFNCMLVPLWWGGGHSPSLSNSLANSYHLPVSLTPSSSEHINGG